MDNTTVYSPPRHRAIRWLLDCGRDVPAEIRFALIASLFGTLPIFIGGVVNTIAMAAVAAVRNPGIEFQVWVVLEIVLGVVRCGVLWHSRRAAFHGQRTPTDLYIYLALAWAAAVGYGTVISMLSGDWVLAAMGCLCTAAMAGGICFRNFGAPRLATLMMTFSMGPVAVTAAMIGEPIFYLTLVQIPFYLFSMSTAAHKLNLMLVSTMRAERDNDYRARHDSLTGLCNRVGLSALVARRSIKQKGRKHGLLYLDLDWFKLVNDSYGHPVGDTLLKMVADRFRHIVGPHDVIARMGGDEFAILAEDMTEENAMHYAQALIDAVSEPYDLGPIGSAQVGVSIGIALMPQHGTDFNSLLERADVALYKAKTTGRSRSCIADADGKGTAASARPALIGPITTVADRSRAADADAGTAHR